MQPNKDYYKILGVGENSSIDEIKVAYRKLAKKFHPDMNPNDKKASEDKFKEVSEAYYVLGDEKRKQEYDTARKYGYADPRGAQRGGSRGGQQAYTYTQGFDINDLLSHLGYSTGGASSGSRQTRGRSQQMDYDMFDEIFGGAFSDGERRGYSNAYSQSPAARKTDTDVNAQIEIPQNLAINGGNIDLSITGRKPITVKIPKGITSGTKLRLTRLGEECPCCGKKGDLLVKIEIRK